MTTQTYRVDVRIDPNQSVRAGKQIEGALTGVENKANSLNSLLKKAFLGVTLVGAAREALGLANAYSQIQNKLRIVTDGQEELADVTERLFKIANDTRNSFEETASLYSRVAVSAKDLGRTQEDLLKFTENLNKAIAISGVTAEQASGGLRQLGQALASGALRGDELVSVSESLPIVLDQISRSMGVARGEIRKLGAEGKLTADIIVDAFTKSTEVLDQQFGKSLITLPQAMTLLRNNLVKFVGEFDQAIGFTRQLGVAIGFVANHIETFAIVLGSVAAAAIAQFLLGPAAALLAWTRQLVLALILANGNVLAILPNLAKLATVRFPVTSFAALSVVIAGTTLAAYELNEQFKELNASLEIEASKGTLFDVDKGGGVREAIVGVRREMALLEKQIAANNGATEDQRKRLELLTGRLQFYTQKNKEHNEQERVRQERVQKTHTETKKYIAALEEEARVLKLSNYERGIQEELFKAVEKLQGKGVKVSNELRADFEARIRTNTALREKAEILNSIIGPEQESARQQQLLNDLLAEGLIRQDQYNKKKAELANDSPSAPQDGGFAFGDLAAQLAALEAQFGKAGLAADQFGAAAAQAVLSAVSSIPTLDGQLSAINQQFRDGRIDVDVYRRSVDQLLNREATAQETAEQLERLKKLLGEGPVDAERYREALRELEIQGLESSKNLADGFERALLKMASQAEDLAAVGEQIANVFADTATNALVEFAETGRFSFRQFATAILSDITRIIARLLVLKAIEAGINALGGGVDTSSVSSAGSGLAAAGASGLGAEYRASGGPVSAGRSYIVGEKGPELLQMGNQSGRVVPNEALGGKPQVNLKVVNVTDPRAIVSAMEDGTADQAFINMLNRTKPQARQTLEIS